MTRTDSALAGALFVACEIEVVLDVLSDHGADHWPLVADVLVVALLTVPLGWRRRAPLISSALVMSAVLLITTALADVPSVNFPQLALFIAPYSVAAWAPRATASLGLAVGILAISASGVLNPEGTASWVFSVVAVGTSWGIGRVMRSHRALTAELQRTSERIAVERAGRELLAIAEQRTRIARELQALVAQSVSTMIVQTEAAQRLLGERPDLADAAMGAVEETGRAALTEMRRILGVLRHDDSSPDLAPQPGIGQVPALVERTRGPQHQVLLTVEGEPGPLPASVDLGVYRILEDALAAASDDAAATEVLLRFGADDITVTVTAQGPAHLDWPTLAMRERVGLCEGTVDVQSVPGPAERLIVTLPRVFDGALT